MNLSRDKKIQELKEKKSSFNKKVEYLAKKYKTTKDKIIESRIYKRKQERPSKEKFYEIFNSFDKNYTKTGKYFGITDNAVR